MKSNIFDLLEGTRAVEVDNAKLDTGMLRHELTPDELSFNPSDGQSIESVLAITDKLFGLLMSWLNNSSLPVTVLSCRYTQALLTSYNNSIIKLFETCKLVDQRLPKNQGEVDIESFEYQLVHRGLRSFIGGLCKFIGFLLNVGTTVLYEEEDLTTRNMDLDFLTQIDINTIMHDINHTIEWLKKQSDPKSIHLIDRLEVIFRMLQIESILSFSFQIEPKSGPTPVLSFVNQVIDILQNKIKNFSSFKDNIPAGSFSKFVQLDLNNRSIPAELYELPEGESFKKLVEMFQQLNEIIVNSSQISNHFQFQNFLEYEVSNRMDSKFNVFIRALYQLFLIRDDKSILGSPNENIMSVTQRMLENLNCVDTQILDDPASGAWGDLKPTAMNSILQKLEQLLGDLERIIYHNLSNVTNNRCRQRQLMSRGLLIWDTLQVSLETFELDVWESQKIGDEIENINGVITPSLPISSFVYYHKLTLMIDILFRGFELDLYKDFEIPQIYWYISYLSQLALDHLQGRIKVQLDLKVKQINSGMTKKIKKLKAGEKKEKLKLLQAEKQKTLIPIIQQTSNYNDNYRTKLYEGYLKLSDSLKLFFIILHGLEILDLFKGPKHSLTSLENIYNLRMKPFSSIGVPNLPEFQHYKYSMNLNGALGKTVSLKQVYNSCLQELKESKEDFQLIINFLADEENKIYNVKGCNGNQEWIDGLLKTSEYYINEVGKLNEMIESPELAKGKKLSVDIDGGLHIYFPKIQIS